MNEKELMALFDQCKGDPVIFADKLQDIWQAAPVASADALDTKRFEWCLPILTAQGKEGDRRAMVLALQFTRGKDGREAIDAAMQEKRHD